MSVAATPYSTPSGGTLPRLVRAGLLTGVTDGLFASVLCVAFYHSTVERGAGRQAHTAGIPVCVASSMAFPLAWDPGKAASSA